MSRHQAHGRRMVTMGDQWRAILAQQPREDQPAQPAICIDCGWQHHGWTCPAHGAGATRSEHRNVDPPRGE